MNFPGEHCYYYKNYEAASAAAAELVIEAMRENPRLKIGLASGHSPAMTYDILGRYISAEKFPVSGLQLVQLDEWLGLGPKHPASCNYFLRQRVIEAWGLSGAQFQAIDGSTAAPEKTMQEMAAALDRVPLDLCILGLGKNGHLALNEPGSTEKDSCRLVDLEPQSQQHQMLLGSSDSVTRGMTIGLKEIAASRHCLLLVSGEGKRSAFQDLLAGKSVATNPASVLLTAPNCTVVVDSTAVNSAL